MFILTTYSVDWVMNMAVKLTKTLTITATLLLVCLFAYLAVNGYLVDQNKMEWLLMQCGIFAPLAFVAFQIIQVVIPIIPGGMSNTVGVILFGPLEGFIYNYLGQMIGSIIAFLLVKKYGKAFILKFVDCKTFDKYITWLDKEKWFDILFAIAIFIPGLPDDAICMIAALTNMSLLKFTAINALCKPMMLVVYSFGVTQVLQWMSGIVG